MAAYEAPSYLRLFLVLASCWLWYLAVLAIYRLYFSPLAKFPGPKLAALTRWYEFYYEVIHNGQFLFHTRHLHERYGWVPARRGLIVESAER